MEEKEKKNIIIDDLEIIDLLRTIKLKKERLWIWHDKVESQSTLIVHICRLRKLDILNRNMQLTPCSDEGFKFTKKTENFYLYSPKKNIAFKFGPKVLEPHYILLDIPQHMSSLSDGLSSKLSPIEQEDEESNIHLRKEPRTIAQENQKAIIKRMAKEGENEIEEEFSLYDISGGGMALKCEDPGTFQKGDLITITTINQNELSQKIEGKVLSIRHMPKDDLFKVGIEFLGENPQH